MISFLTENLATIIISSILILIVYAIVAQQIKNKKNGKTSCGCGCSGCAMSSICHKNTGM